MKVAFWILGLFVLGLFGIIMINLFGNITVTNQLNYTTMKNAVEASMYDSLDIAHYRTGFCLCTDMEKQSGKWVFNDDSEYELLDITYDDNNKEICASQRKKCEILKGEYRLNKEVFTESLIRRFAEMVNNNKDYEMIIQDIIEYPPKVSVRISSTDKEFMPTDDRGDEDDYVIVNQMDAIIETKKDIYATPTPLPTPKFACYSKATNSDPPYVFEWKEEKTYDGWTKVSAKTVSNQSDCRQACYKNGNTYEWGYPKTHAKASGWVEQSGINKKADCKYVAPTPTQVPGQPSSGKCKWHYVNNRITCRNSSREYKDVYNAPCPDGYTLYQNLTGLLKRCSRYVYTNKDISVSMSSARGSSETQSAAVEACIKAARSKCTSAGYISYVASNCMGVQDYKCTKGKETKYTQSKLSGWNCQCLG